MELIKAGIMASRKQSSQAETSSASTEVSREHFVLYLIGHYRDLPCYEDIYQNWYIKSKKGTAETETAQYVEVQPVRRPDLVEDSLWSIYMLQRRYIDDEVELLPRSQLTDLYTYYPEIQLCKAQEGKRQIGTLYIDEDGRYYRAETMIEHPVEENQSFAAKAFDSRGENYRSEGGNIYHLVMGMPLDTRAEQGTQTAVTAHVSGTLQSTIRQNTARIVNTAPGYITPQAHKSAQAGITPEVFATTKVARLSVKLKLWSNQA